MSLRDKVAALVTKRVGEDQDRAMDYDGESTDMPPDDDNPEDYLYDADDVMDAEIGELSEAELDDLEDDIAEGVEDADDDTEDIDDVDDDLMQAGDDPSGPPEAKPAS